MRTFTVTFRVMLTLKQQLWLQLAHAMRYKGKNTYNTFSRQAFHKKRLGGDKTASELEWTPLTGKWDTARI